MWIREARAHSEEVHETTVEATTHYFEFLLDPLYAILTFFLFLTLLIIVLRALKLQMPLILLFSTIASLGAGVLGFIFVPPLGVVSITLGFSMALLLTLTGVRKT